MRIAVCDDNASFLQSAVEMIRAWSEQSGIAAEIFAFSNGDELLSKATQIRMDVIFLDIIMPMLNGMDAARELRQRDTAVKIIFLTSSPEFALESYDVKAQGYLLKPVRFEKVKEALDDCARSAAAEPQSIVAKTSFGFQKLYIHDLEYAEAQNKRVIFSLRTGLSVEATEPLHSFEDQLTDCNGFFKCHRSYLVYLPNVDHFNSAEIITKSGRCIPIARGYAKAFKDAYFALMFRD